MVQNVDSDDNENSVMTITFVQNADSDDNEDSVMTITVVQNADCSAMTRNTVVTMSCKTLTVMSTKTV